MPTVTVDLREGFEDDTVEVWLDRECRWRGDSVTTNLAVSLAASVPLAVETGVHELKVNVATRGLDAALGVEASADVHVAADVSGGNLGLQRLAEKPYYL